MHRYVALDAHLLYTLGVVSVLLLEYTKGTPPAPPAKQERRVMRPALSGAQ